ncbi:hypothetical protein RS130_07645 [Paraglaciecola aquimarina]|uniref:Uncharacterized protein n=1 Tax=Paraglaciecola aquimarina TaxID=1235557 RepID=A0ABU3SV04_9ALTE|nr:hypothetical protein [Paraglaciecola aquimarina]MDU0353816.1 hypothetical protein [Paraglaciecola aquimarina]
MAEYSEFVAADGTLSTFNFSHLKHQSHPMEIPIILAYEGDWHIGNHYELYENSKALFYFLMSHEVGRQVISKIMTLETENYCSGLSKDRIEDILEGYLPNFEQEFDYWFSDNLYIFLN